MLHVSVLPFRIALVAALVVCACGSLLAQDTLPKFSLKDFSFELKGGLVYQGIPWGSVIVPQYLREQNPATPSYAGDEPLIHGSAFLDAGAGFRMNGFFLHAQLIAEHRGQSKGVYNMRAIDVYPKFLAGIDTSFPVLGHRLGFAVSAGNYDDIRLQQGLTMYNLDIQGSRWSLAIDRLCFTYQKLADLQYWIDLNQNDGNNYSIKLDSVPLPENLAVTFEYATSSPTGVVGYYSNAVGRYLTQEDAASNSFSLRLTHASGIAVYAEYGTRNVSGPDNAAYLAGASYGLNTHWF